MSNRRKLTAEEESWAANLRKQWEQREVDPKTGKKMSQEKAAELAGWARQSTVSQYLRGIIPLNTDAIIAFSAIIPCQPQDINPSMGFVGPGTITKSDIAFFRQFLELSPQSKKAIQAATESLSETPTNQDTDLSPR